MTYATLDMKAKAEALRDQMILEIQDVEAAFDYHCATGGIYAPSQDEVIEHDKYVQKLRDCLKALNVYLKTYDEL